MLQNRTDVYSYDERHHRLHGFMDDNDEEVQAEVSLPEVEFGHVSLNLSSSSLAPYSPILSSSEFLKRFHIHLSPNSLASHALKHGTFTSSPELGQNQSSFGSSASNHSRALKLPLPIPDQSLRLPGENEDLYC
jgi:hypothetical protein